MLNVKQRLMCVAYFLRPTDFASKSDPSLYAKGNITTNTVFYMLIDIWAESSALETRIARNDGRIGNFVP